jgi:hypothetical protein
MSLFVYFIYPCITTGFVDNLIIMNFFVLRLKVRLQIMQWTQLLFPSLIFQFFHNLKLKPFGKNHLIGHGKNLKS